MRLERFFDASSAPFTVYVLRHRPHSSSRVFQAQHFFVRPRTFTLSMSTLAKPANGVSSPASVTKASTPKPDAAKQSNEANASSRPWWRDIKQPRVSMHTDPVWGLKVSKVRRTRAKEENERKLSDPRERRDGG